MWFNRNFCSNQMVSAIGDDTRKMVHMYLGGGVANVEEAPLIRGVVVICSSWKWASYVHAAARITGLECDNPQYKMSTKRMIVEGMIDKRQGRSKRAEFESMCEDVWKHLMGLMGMDLQEYEPENPLCYHDRLTQVKQIRARTADMKKSFEEAVRVRLQTNTQSR